MIPPAPVKRRFRSGQIVAIGVASLSTILLTGALIFFYFVYPVFRAGPAQPVPFSHRLHVTVKEIDCRFCHNTVETSRNAGLPSAEKCLFCHEHVITQHPVIQNLRRYRDEGVPIPWRKVTYLPDHAYFSHQQHIRAGINCASCHGNVDQMDRVWEANRLLMGFCVDCHRGRVAENRHASLDCHTCHQ